MSPNPTNPVVSTTRPRGRSEELHLDPAQERAAKAVRDRRYHVVDVPRLRVLGFVMLVALVALHREVAPGVGDEPALGGFAAVLAVYTFVSWIALARFYRMEARVHLGRLFLLTDLAPLAAAVWATGGSQSWLFVLPYLRVFDQVHIGVRWCLVCTAGAVSAHAGVIVLDRVAGAQGALPLELFKLTACATFALYLSMTSLTAERLRRRNSRSVAVARDLVRALELQKADLERARREAESAAVAKGAFLATMSHEIRTPMNGIIGMIELALDASQENDRREFLATARSSANALLQIIGDVLDFSKIDAGQLAVEVTAFDPREVVRQALQVVSVIARPKGLALTSRFADDLPRRVVGDPLRTKQVLLNLLGNAVKFTAHGSVDVAVTRGADFLGRPTLQYAVTDTGIGIAPEHQALVFEAFTQAEMATSRRYGGTGLGLAISRRLTELMGGTLTLVSVPGTGSTFTLNLPAATAADEAPGAAPSPPAATPTTRVALRATEPLRVLLVEDNPVNQRVARIQLERWGHTVTVAENGAEAITCLDQGHFDVALMDVQMPVLDGLEATRELRHHGTRSRAGAVLPIIAMTANALEGDRERCLAAGMDAYLAKPIQAAQLFALLESLPRGSTTTSAA